MRLGTKAICNLKERWINPAVRLVRMVEKCSALRVRLNCASSSDHGSASFIHGLPVPNAGSCKNRSPERGAILGLHNFYRMSVHVSLNLAPKSGPGSSAAQSNTVDGQVHFAEDG